MSCDRFCFFSVTFLTQAKTLATPKSTKRSKKDKGADKAEKAAAAAEKEAEGVAAVLSYTAALPVFVFFSRCIVFACTRLAAAALAAKAAGADDAEHEEPLIYLPAEQVSILRTSETYLLVSWKFYLKLHTGLVSQVSAIDPDRHFEPAHAQALLCCAQTATLTSTEAQDAKERYMSAPSSTPDTCNSDSCPGCFAHRSCIESPPLRVQDTLRRLLNLVRPLSFERHPSAAAGAHM